MGEKIESATFGSLGKDEIWHRASAPRERLRRRWRRRYPQLTAAAFSTISSLLSLANEIKPKLRPQTLHIITFRNKLQFRGNETLGQERGRGTRIAGSAAAEVVNSLAAVPLSYPDDIPVKQSSLISLLQVLHRCTPSTWSPLDLDRISVFFYNKQSVIACSAMEQCCTGNFIKTDTYVARFFV